MAYLLIVDDDEDFAIAAATVLRSAGHDVAIELDTGSAVTNMEKRVPDLLILDVMFPEQVSGGFELARHLRHEHPKFKSLAILLLTAVNAKFPLGFSARDIDSDWLPVADFLEKPVDFSVLVDKVKTLLDKAKAAS